MAHWEAEDVAAEVVVFHRLTLLPVRQGHCRQRRRRHPVRTQHGQRAGLLQRAAAAPLPCTMQSGARVKRQAVPLSSDFSDYPSANSTPRGPGSSDTQQQLRCPAQA